jgi:small conductance mechanosensitive channel
MSLNTLTYLEVAASIAVLAVLGYSAAQATVRRIAAKGAPPVAIRLVRVLFAAACVAVGLAIISEFIGPINFVSGLTVSAVVGLALTLALQTTLANVIAGFILMQGRMLRLHDSVSIGGVKGRVVQLGLVTTWLRLEDGTVASVSNNTLLAGPMVNQSAPTRLKGEF